MPGAFDPTELKGVFGTNFTWPMETCLFHSVEVADDMFGTEETAHVDALMADLCMEVMEPMR